MLLADYKASPEDGVEPKEPLKILKKLFVYSQMEVLNEHRSEYQYHHLGYIEFLEFVCRFCEYVKEDNEKLHNVVF